MAYPFDEQETGQRLRANATDTSELQRRLAAERATGDALRNAATDNSELRGRLTANQPPQPATIAQTARNVPLGNVTPNAAAVNPGTLYVDSAGTAKPAINPNVASGTPSAEAAEYLKGKAAPAAPATIAEVAKPGVRAGIAAQEGLLGKATYGAGRALGAIASRAGPAALGAAAISDMGNYKIEPGVDSSAGGTIRALAKGDFSGAGRSLKNGAIESVLDLGSTAAGIADTFVPGKAPVSTAYDQSLRKDFPQISSNANAGGVDSLRASLGLGPKGGAGPGTPQPQPTPPVTAAPATIAAAAPQVLPPPVTAPAQAAAAPRTGARQPTIAAAAPQPQGAPAIGEGSVEIIRPGGVRTVAIPTAGGYVEVPHEQFTTGNGAGFIQSVAKGQNDAVDPVTARTGLELSKIAAEGANQRSVAGIQAGSAGNVAGINAGSAKTVAEIGAENARKNLMVIPGEETLAPDGFTKLKGPTRLYDNSTGQFIEPPAAQKQAAPTPGMVKNGYRFKGGDPANKKSWEKV